MAIQCEWPGTRSRAGPRPQCTPHSETNKPSRRSLKSPAPRVQCEKVAGACKGRLLYKYDRTGLGQPAHPAAGFVHPGAHGPHSLAVGQDGLVAPGCDPSDAGEPHHLRHYHASCPAGCHTCHHLPAPDHPAERLLTSQRPSNNATTPAVKLVLCWRRPF